MRSPARPAPLASLARALAVASLLAPMGCRSSAAEADAGPSSSGSATPASSVGRAGSSAGPPSAEPSGSVSPASAPPLFEPVGLPEPELDPPSIALQREAMLRRMRAVLGTTDAELAALEAVFRRSPAIGQGHPAATVRPMSRTECLERRRAAGVADVHKPHCGARFMVPIWDPGSGEREDDARVCVDRYEFPGMPCEYPVTWATAREAALLCKAVGKRLCDAHEWEGACAGAVLDPVAEYGFGPPRKGRYEAGQLHNKAREVRWAYGLTKDHGKCATGSAKSKGCTATGGFLRCGSNAYPAGAFPACVSPFGVYDQHGNVAEHMSLPARPEDLGGRGGVGDTEMKGSWFIFQEYEAHTDDCRWRAPDWHGTRVMDHKSHANYHLGFRCCRDVGGATHGAGGATEEARPGTTPR
jgi:sulfatase modifying factor 1